MQVNKLIYDMQNLINKYKSQLEELDEPKQNISTFFELCFILKEYDFGKNYRGKGFKKSTSELYRLIKDIQEDNLLEEYPEKELFIELDNLHKEHKGNSYNFINEFIIGKRKLIEWSNNKYSY